MERGATLQRLFGEEVTEEEFAREYINIVLAGEAISAEPQQENYGATWEEAFLFDGYENGKFFFLTGFVALSIKRHGFKVYTEAHLNTRFLQKPIRNIIITRLVYEEQDCIPDRDAKGNPVVLGITNPRDYLPKKIQQILDDEFGYDRDVYDPHR